jgi:signal transduction histidine kinase
VAQSRSEGGTGLGLAIVKHILADQRTVIVFADWSTDVPVYATFPLDEPILRYQYDQSALVEWFQSSDIAR